MKNRKSKTANVDNVVNSIMDEEDDIAEDELLKTLEEGNGTA